MVRYLKLAFIFLVALLILKLSMFNINKNNYYWDESVYLDIAKNMRETKSYSSTMNENFRAPLLPLLLAFTPNTDTAHLLVALLSALSIFLIFLVGKELANKTTGIFAAIFLATNPLYNFWSYKLLTEPLALCLILLSMYLFLKSRNGNGSYLCLSFLTAGLAVLARYTSVTLVAALAIAELLNRKASIKKLFWPSVMFLVAVSPLLFLGMSLYNNPLGMMLQNSAETSYPDMPLTSYLSNPLYNLGYFTAFFFLFGISQMRKRSAMIWLYLAITAALLALVNQKYERFLIILLPAYAIIAATGFSYLHRHSEKLKGLLVVLTLVLSLIVAYQNANDLEAEKHNTGILIDAASFVKNHPCDTVISNSTKHFTYFSQKPTTGYPGEEQEFLGLLNEPEQTCFVIDSYHGTPRYRKFINDTYKPIYANSSGNKFVYVYST